MTYSSFDNWLTLTSRFLYPRYVMISVFSSWIAVSDRLNLQHLRSNALINIDCM
jgi:hypothetical protein